MFLEDSRDYQLIFLSLFLFLGLNTRDWTLHFNIILVAIASCLLTQWCLSSWQEYRKKILDSYPVTINRYYAIIFSPTVVSSLRSGLITALGLCLLLRTNNHSTMMLAGLSAIASKFLFRRGNKHFYNPANFGMIAALTLTNDAWVSPGQWGTDWWYLLLFAGAGGLVLKRVGRWDTSVTFLLTYTSLEAMRNWWLGWSWDVWWHQLSSGSLLLFALFMLTDPRSIPNAQASRILWSVMIAIVSVVLKDWFYLSTGIFWALFWLAPLTIILDEIWSAPRFVWKSEPELSM
jgi:Na+-transporting NADH:ubiquinone oxidoreductase subunit NqrB